MTGRAVIRAGAIVALALLASGCGARLAGVERMLANPACRDLPAGCYPETPEEEAREAKLDAEAAAAWARDNGR